MIQPRQIYLDALPIFPQQFSSSTGLRCIFNGALKSLLERTNHTLITCIRDAPNPETFVNSLQQHPKFYQSSMPRQFAAGLPFDLEKTTLYDQPQDWFIKTADFGDTHDRVLQHRDGEYTQLFKDLARYNSIFQEDCDQIIVLRPPTHIGYDIQLTAAMQCLGYTKEQFQVIIIQPLKLYAFHIPTQKIHSIPDLSIDELIQAIGKDALLWYSFSTPLSEIAPINISTAGQSIMQNSLYRIQTAHAWCCSLLRQGHQQEMIQLSTIGEWQIMHQPLCMTNCNWANSNAISLAKQVQLTPQILQESANKLAPHLLCEHLETISDLCYQWCNSLEPDIKDYVLLLATKQVISNLLENILDIKASDSLQFELPQNLR